MTEDTQYISDEFYGREAEIQLPLSRFPDSSVSSIILVDAKKDIRWSPKISSNTCGWTTAW